MAGSELAGRPIVVGVDGTNSSEAAVHLAARQATLHNRPLLLLHAIEANFGADSPERSADDHLAVAMAAARQTAPGAEVVTEISTLTPAAALVGASARAAMVVVGAHGHSSVGGVLSGSTAVQVTTHAVCPVLVSRGSQAADGDVVLGVDGSPDAESTIAFAFEAASMTDTALHAVHAWHHPIARGGGDSLPILYMDADVEAQATRLLAEATSGWAERYPDVIVRRSVIRGRAAHALLEASAGASMLVVGARGRGGFTELLLGSVGLTLIHRSTCPVAVVRSGAYGG